MHCSAFLIAVVLPLQFSSAAPTISPAAGSDGSEKLNLNAVGAVMEFGLQNALHLQSSYNFAIDGSLETDWDKCAASNFAEQTDFLINLRGFYPVDRIAVLSRGGYAGAAEVFVGNLSDAGRSQNQFQCGGKHPDNAPSSFTEFRCSTTVWIQYIRIRKSNTGRVWDGRSLQICEVAIYHHHQKYDLGRINAQLQFKLSGYLKKGSSYEMATDGKLDTCVPSILWSGGETVLLKIDLKEFYLVTNVTVSAPKSQSSRVYVSDTPDFPMKNQCNQTGDHFHCSGSHQVRYITIVGKSHTGTSSQVCEVEVFYKPKYTTLPCQCLPHLPNSTAVTDWKTATYTCSNNRVPETQTITCLPTGHWSGTLQQCRPKMCPDIGHPRHGEISLPPKKTSRSTVTYSCSTCYRLHGNKTRQCQQANDGKSLKWSGSEPVCQVVHCGDAPVVEKATVRVVSKICGGTALYKCKGGATLFGSSHLFCGPEGRWLGTVPTCLLIPQYGK